jgi:hypothetical protein
MNFATAILTSTSQSPDFVLDGDNAAMLNAFLASLPEGSKVVLPSGVWPTTIPLQVNKKVALEAPEGQQVRFVLTATGVDTDVFRVGDYSTGVAVDDVSIKGIEFELTGDRSSGQMQCLEICGNNFKADKCKWIGSPHEGVVVHGLYSNAVFADCEAIHCGFGNSFYGLPLAGFNSHSVHGDYIRCKATNCGQGFELGAHFTRALYCEIENDPEVKMFDGSPMWGGFNIGSYTFGVWNVEIAFCKTKGGGAASFANGNGRLANVWIHDNIFHGVVRTSGTGGMFENKGGPVPNPNPESGVSIVERNVYVLTGTDHHAIGTHSGLSNEEGLEHEREEIEFRDNTIIYQGPADGPNTSPIAYVAGRQKKVKFLRNKFIGFDVAPARGDFQTFSVHANPSVIESLAFENNMAIKSDGTSRPLVLNIEGRS